MKQDSLRIALFGSGPETQRWAWALAEHASLASLDSRSFARADAVVLATGAQEPLSKAREAVSQGLPVLWACGQLPHPGELAQLGSSGQEEAFVRIYEAFLHQGGFGLLQRFLRGPEPFWRPLYLRMVAGFAGGDRLEEAAIQAMGTVHALLDVDAEQVTAHAARQEDGEPCALFMTVQYCGGPLLQFTASLSGARQELVAVTRDRRLTLENDRLRIAPNSRCSNASARERVLRAPSSDPVSEEARRFVNAVSNHDTAEGNIERWLKVAELWAAARRSLSQGGTVWVRQPVVVETRTPPVRLIEGGVGAARITSGRRLTLVAS